MADFPGQAATPTIISSFTRHCYPTSNRTWAAALAGTSVAWPSANRAIYIPLILPWPYVVRRVFWANGSVLGNMAMGIYTASGTRLFTTGSTAQSGASVMQFVSLGTELLLSPGYYYLCLDNDGTTNRVWGTITPTVSQGRHFGLVQQDVGSLTLPATMTAAILTSFIWPLCGITRYASGL